MRGEDNDNKLLKLTVQSDLELLLRRAGGRHVGRHDELLEADDAVSYKMKEQKGNGPIDLRQQKAQVWT